MSYDIFFVRRDPGQSFEDALDATEASFQGDPGPLSAVELELWDDILPIARDVLGEIEEFGDETTRELSDPRTGIQLSVFNGEMAIHVPFTDYAEKSVDVMATVYDLARAIERETGLEGYDPQLQEPVTEQPGGGAGGSRRDAVDWDEDDESESDGTSTSLPAVRPRRARETAAAGDDGEDRRWWKFWKS